MNTVLKVFLIEAALFGAAILLGIAVSLRLENIFAYASSVSGEQITSGMILLYFLLATLLILLVLRVAKKYKSHFFRFMLIFSVIIGGYVTLLVFLGAYALPVLLILVVLLIKKPLVILHNLGIIVAIAGAGAIIGTSLEPLHVIVIAAVLSIYDIIAVYKTRHMVEMARGMIEAKSVLGLVVPFYVKDFFSDLKNVNLEDRFMILGGGDIMIPLLLCASFVSQGVFYSLFIFVFSLIGLFLSFLFFITPQIKRPIPALPPIVFSVAFGYLLLEVFYHIGSL